MRIDDILTKSGAKNKSFRLLGHSILLVCFLPFFQSAETTADAGVSAFLFVNPANAVVPFPRLLPADGDAYGREFLTLQLKSAK